MPNVNTVDGSATAKACKRKSFLGKGFWSRVFHHRESEKALYFPLPSCHAAVMTRLQRHCDGSITLHTEISVRVSACPSILKAEDQLMDAVNQAGAEPTGQLLSSLDADGYPLVNGDGWTLTAKRLREKRQVEPPYGCLVVERWAYQTSEGGIYHYPFDRAASLIGMTTPKSAQMISRKMVELPAAKFVLTGAPTSAVIFAH